MCFWDHMDQQFMLSKEGAQADYGFSPGSLVFLPYVNFPMHKDRKLQIAICKRFHQINKLSMALICTIALFH